MSGSQAAIVTGASRGIGAAVARSLADRGLNLVLAARSSELIDALADELSQRGIRAIAVPTDVTDPTALDQLVEVAGEAFGSVSVLVNNAGALPTAKRHEQTDLDEWRAVLDLNLTSMWYLSTRTYPLMVESGGVVVNIASTAAHYPSIGLGPYCVSKAAVLMLTRSLALEWARKGIRVVSISPGKVDTELVKPIVQWVETNGMPLNLLDRLGGTDELAELISFVASPAGGYLTGCDIAFDGGELTTLPSPS